MNRRIIVCGDDFGLSDSTDEALLSLAANKRLSAVSCLVDGPRFYDHADRLALQDVDIGLHLNFSEALSEATADLPGLAALIARAYAGRLDTAWVDAQLQRQFTAFENAFGRPPDHVDGHQHVHQLPGIRSRLLLLLARRFGTHRFWLRQTRSGALDGIALADAFKAHVITALGAKALGRAIRDKGLCSNRSMLGVYRFYGGRQVYAGLLRCWLHNAQNEDLILCHPAAFAAPGDAFSSQRVAEFDVWSDSRVDDWLLAERLKIVRFSSPA